MKFVKFDNYWWEYDEKTPLNNASIERPYGKGWFNILQNQYKNLKNAENAIYAKYKIVSGKDITNCEIVEANGYGDLDWTGTSVLNNSSKYGWLDRDGNFYGCGCEDHDNQAEFVHHSSTEELEKKGWIHITNDAMHHTGMAVSYFTGDLKNGIIPTEKQLYYLVCHKEIYSNQVFCMYEKAMENKKRWHKKMDIEF